MNRKAISALMAIFLIAGLGMVYYFWGDSLRLAMNKEQKPAINTKTADIKMDAGTPIILEKEYSRSNKVVISEFENKQDVIGYTLDEIRSKYTSANGFKISFKDGSLVIRQTIDDWSPEDKAKCRLKEYQDMVAIYNGPNTQNDSLLKVTAIRFSTLPANIKEAIQQGKYEFENEAAINDALENLDEYF